jgi:16S rRNA (cytosine1402-N4)-methyltransferase
METKQYHIPVMVDEVLQYLQPRKGGCYVDATFGGGGHTQAILDAEPTCRVVAIDWDKQALDINGPALEEKYPGRIEFIWTNFGDIERQLKRRNVKHVDGILADFGTSQYQIAQRAGFSFSADTQLDMRMSPENQKTTAAIVVNKATYDDLVYIFQMYGEEPFARRIARAIEQTRKKQRIQTTRQLADIVKRAVPRVQKKIHPATRAFQALRIFVNKELENIRSFLYHAEKVLDAEGRLVCISFHSLEDRLVKQYMKDHVDSFDILTPRVVLPTDEEVAMNPSARSARLRAAKKI